MAIALDLLTGGELMGGTGVLLVPGTAAFMLVVGLLAAAGPARRGLRVQPTEALRAE
jgi:ABC-type antimicrobial peptide transport system permease subunit